MGEIARCENPDCKEEYIQYNNKQKYCSSMCRRKIANERYIKKKNN